MNFPNRPDHPDFWLISQAVIDLDAQMDNKTSTFEDTIGRTVDPASLRYVAEQRSLRINPKPGNAAFKAAFGAAWMDAFMAGAMYQSLKQRDAQSFNPNEGDPDQ